MNVLQRKFYFFAATVNCTTMKTKIDYIQFGCMIKRCYATVLIAVVTSGLLAAKLQGQSLPAPLRYVDPMIGTSGHGHTYPGASLPFGFLQLSPDTDDRGWDWSSGYHYSDNSIMGFSHTHLSGTGISDLADILIMPYTGRIRLHPGAKDVPGEDGYRSTFVHSTEVAEPGYYAVTLDKHNIRAELTTAEQLALHRYTFPDTDSARLMIDLQHGLDRHRSWLTERVLDAEIRLIDSVTLRGYRVSSGWANVQQVFFELRLSQPIQAMGVATDDIYRDGSTFGRGRNIKTVLTFSTRADTPLEIRLALSAVPETIRPLWPQASLSFDEQRRQAAAQWQQALSVVEIQAPDSVRTIFYTALYHSLLTPNRIWDEQGQLSYTTLSQWDVYRAAFALHTLFRPEMTDALLQTLWRDYQQNGYLTVWKLWQDEVNCMIGTPSVPIVAEALLKGQGALADSLYEAVYSSLTTDNPVAPWSMFDRYGYIPNDLGERFTVSKTLEMSYANGCAALLARARGDAARDSFYSRRAGYYANLFDPASGFFRGKTSQGEWVSGFDPTVTDEKDFVEATPWQYLFHAQHDVPGMIALQGGPVAFGKKLDALFSAGTGRIDAHILDITGLIGQYAHGNEPSHHVAFLYNYIGQAWKTQARVQEICRRFYTTQPDGLCGNEDCGQMSAWYLFASLGFYPVHPASGLYDICTPMVESARLKLGNGKTMDIRCRNYGPDKKYIAAVYLNGKRLRQPRLRHEEMMAGGQIIFELSASPVESTFEPE